MRRMRHSRAGFTVVELIAAMVSASILVITMGALVEFQFRAVKRGRSEVNMHRDATFVMTLVRRRIRESRANWILQPDPTDPLNNPAQRIVTLSQAIYRAPIDDPSTFDPAGEALAFDPNTSVASDEIFIAPRFVDEFTCTHMSNSIQVVLVMEDESSVRSETEVYFRNEAN